MHHVLTILLVAAITYMAWKDRAQIAPLLRDEWEAFLDTLEVIG